MIAVAMHVNAMLSAERKQRDSVRTLLFMSSVIYEPAHAAVMGRARVAQRVVRDTNSVC